MPKVLEGRERLSPQSPRDKDTGVVVMAACVGYGKVAVSESNMAANPRGRDGLGSGGGNEKSLEFLRRLAVGDSLPPAIVSHKLYRDMLVDTLTHHPLPAHFDVTTDV